MVKSAKFLCAFLFLGAVAQAQTQGSAAAATAQFNIPADQYAQFPFTVPVGVTNVKISGSFKATGGPASAIIVIVMNDAQFANWAQKKPCVGPGNACTPQNGGALYNSGPEIQGNFSLDLPDVSANYHVVFNNAFYNYAKTIQDNLMWTWVNPR
jgi:hypothetical protein